MNEKELKEKLLKLEKELQEYRLNINGFIWQSQEGKNNHFDNFNKSEQIAFIDLYSKIQALCNCLVSYNSWFIK